MRGVALIGRRVRVWDAQRAVVLAEGAVVAWMDRPTIDVREDSGRQHSWLIDLPIDVLDDAPRLDLSVWTTRDLLDEIATRIRIVDGRPAVDATSREGMLG